MNISPAKIHFNQQGTPIASTFDDVYFSNANGLQESQYVFLANNGLPQRWNQWQQDEFTIAETGFGTGLNFLVSWHHFNQFRQTAPSAQLQRLHFISVEKYPLTRADLAQALTAWPQLEHLAKELVQQYPDCVPGCHRLQFAQGKIILDLYFADIEQMLPQLYTGPNGLVDAWYLDGFAPAKNPQMWQPQLFAQMARLATDGCTFATFTAAGLVKRGLAAAGFNVEKRQGFGRKRDMLAGQFITEQLNQQPDFNSQRQQAAYYVRHAASRQKKQVSIIGAGLAGACCAYALGQKGYKVTVYEQAPTVAAGASGNRQGGFYPQLNAEASINSRIQALSFVYACRQYQQLLTQGYDFAHDFCGVLQLAFTPKVAQRYRKLIDNKIWPPQMVQWFTHQQSSQQAGIELPYDSLWLAQGGWINPAQLVKALLQASTAQGQCELFTHHQLSQLDYHQDQWHLRWQNGSLTQADIVVFATGSDSDKLSQLQALPLRKVRGQVEKIPSQTPIDQLQSVLCHKGYLTPASQGYHAMGSTYVKNDLAVDYRLHEQQLNLHTQAQALAHCQWAQKLVTENQGRAAIRCTSPDHLPLVGAVADFAQQSKQYAELYKAKPARHYPIAADLPNLYLLTGLGSRGLTTAPLMAELLASQIAGTALPLSNDLLNALNPNRFLLRRLIRAC